MSERISDSLKANILKRDLRKQDVEKTKEIKGEDDHGLKGRESKPEAGMLITEDVVSISPKSTEAYKIRQWVDMLKAMPDERNEKVEDVKKRIAEGEYPSTDMLSETAREIGIELGVLPE